VRDNLKAKLIDEGLIERSVVDNLYIDDHVLTTGKNKNLIKSAKLKIAAKDLQKYPHKRVNKKEQPLIRESIR
jgi:hypothetical protein